MAYDFIAELERVGALKTGHFLLSSGRHSERYVEKFELLKDPLATARACEELIRLLGDDADVDLVAGPTTGGILLAYEVARQLAVPAAYAERASEGSHEREFKRGAVPGKGSRVLIVDDILTTGGSVRATLHAVKRCEAEVVGVAVLVDRSDGSLDLGVPLLGLAVLEIDTWPPNEIPDWL
ncbi:MAG: orotate phosphoribosyltransferase, partial [Chloroflexota bacterium]